MEYIILNLLYRRYGVRNMLLGKSSARGGWGGGIEEGGWGCVNVFRNARSIMFSYVVAYSVQTAGR